MHKNSAIKDTQLGSRCSGTYLSLLKRRGKMTLSTKWQRYSFNQDPSLNVRNWDTADENKKNVIRQN